MMPATSPPPLYHCHDSSTSASAVASAFFSPSKAAEQQAITQQWARVDAWLKRMYSSGGDNGHRHDGKAVSEDDKTAAGTATTGDVVPGPSRDLPEAGRLLRVERNEATLHVLQALMAANERAEKEAEAALALLEEAAAAVAEAEAEAESESESGSGTETETPPSLPPSPQSPPSPLVDPVPHSPSSPPNRPPSTSRSSNRTRTVTTTTLLETTLAALPPPYHRQFDALAGLVADLGLPVHPSVEDAASLSDVGAPDLATVAVALAGHDFFGCGTVSGDELQQPDPPSAHSRSTGGGAGERRKRRSGVGHDVRGKNVICETYISGNPAADPVFPPPVHIPAASHLLAQNFASREGQVRTLASQITGLTKRVWPVGDEGDGRAVGAQDGESGRNDVYIGPRTGPADEFAPSQHKHDQDQLERGVDLDGVHIETMEMNRQTAMLKARAAGYETNLSLKLHQGSKGGGRRGGRAQHHGWSGIEGIDHPALPSVVERVLGLERDIRRGKQGQGREDRSP